MLQLIKTNKCGIEMYLVMWSNSEGSFTSRDFWSVDYAKAFIARTFTHINVSTIEVTYVKG